MVALIWQCPECELWSVNLFEGVTISCTAGCDPTDLEESLIKSWVRVRPPMRPPDPLIAGQN
jgi:hypothetical protein